MNYTSDYRDGRTDGTFVFERFGPQDADGVLEYLEQLETLPLFDKNTQEPTTRPDSLYLIAFRRSLNEAIGNSLS